jgi:adenylate kinase
MNVLLIGPPGSGKGTQGIRVAGAIGAEHIAAGDLLRAELRSGSALGQQLADVISRGDLVPDIVVLGLVLPAVLRAVAGGGYVLDGFPRSVRQAEIARELGALANARPDAVIYLDVKQPELVRRILVRAAAEGRTDDTAEVIDNRLSLFDQVTRPLIDHYDQRGLLRVVSAEGPADDITTAILAALTLIRPSTELPA